MLSLLQRHFLKVRRRGLATFTLVAAGLIGLAIFWRTAVMPYREHFTLYFEENIHGLSSGALVLMNGQTVGRVEDIRIARAERGNATRYYAAVTIVLDSKKIHRGGNAIEPGMLTDKLPELISRGFRGKLILISMLAAGLSVELLFEPTKPPPPLADIPGADYPEIPAYYVPTSSLVDKAYAFIEARRLYAAADAIRAARERISAFEKATEGIDFRQANARALRALAFANEVVSPEAAHESLARLNAEISSIRAALREGVAADSPEKLAAAAEALKELTGTLRETGRRAQFLQQLLSEENLEAQRELIREIRDRYAPLLDSAKGALF